MPDVAEYVYVVVRIHRDGRLWHPRRMLDPRVILPTYQPVRPAGDATTQSAAPGVVLAVGALVVVAGMFFWTVRR